MALVHHWTMEDTSDETVVADAAGATPLDVDGVSPSLVTGRVGLARQFAADINGDIQSLVSAAITAAAREILLTSSYSVALWMKPATGGGDFQALLLADPSNTNNSLFHLYFKPAGGGEVFVGWGNGNTGLGDTGPIPDEQWTHLAVTYERISDFDGTYRLYRNGALVLTETGWNPPDTDQPEAFWQLGGRTLGGHSINTGEGDPFSGLLDDVRFYDTALTDAEVYALAYFDAPAPGATSRARRISLPNNADAAALETARAALTASSGQPVWPSGGSAMLVVTIPGEAITSGYMRGFARMPETFNSDGTVSTHRWTRWANGDIDCNNVSLMEATKGPVNTPAGATAIITLPEAIGGTSSVTTVALNLFFQPNTMLA